MKYKLKNKEIELTDEEVKEIVKQNSEPKEEKKIGLEIKNRFTGEVIFTSTKITYKEAVEEAVSQNADLRNADLENADLENADLRNADLRNTNLWDANLRNADLENAYLENADLEDADLRDANLRNAKFYGRGGTIKLTKAQVPVFLKALGFLIED